jgi:tetratricopeptide (TPR) repeat protein
LGDPEPRIRQAWSDLAELAERENPGTGPAVLERLIEKQPEDPQVHLLYARFLFERGRSEEALAHLEARADQGIEPALLLDEATRLSLEKGDVETARRHAQRLGDEQPGQARTLLAKARLALAIQNPAGAVELLGDVNELEESAESQRLLALAQLRLANLAAAQQAVGRSLELEPRSVGSLRLQAQIYSQSGDWAAVLQTLLRLRAAGARLPTATVCGAPLFTSFGQEKGAHALDDILATDPPPEAAVLAFVRHESQRDPEKAARLIEEALARNPNSLALLPMATAFDLRAGKGERALERLNLALEARPDLPMLLALRAQVLARADRLEEAERDAQRAFEISPAMPNLLELILAIYQRRGRIDVAIDQFEASESAGTEPGAALLRAASARKETPSAPAAHAEAARGRSRASLARRTISPFCSRARDATWTGLSSWRRRRSRSSARTPRPSTRWAS